MCKTKYAISDLNYARDLCCE